MVHKDVMITFNRGAFSVNKVIFTVDDVNQIEHLIAKERVCHIIKMYEKRQEDLS